MTNNDLLTDTFPVTLPNGTVLACRKFDLIGENRVLSELGRALLASYGPGSYLANARPVLDWLTEQKMHADRQQMVSELTRLVATKAQPTFEAVMDFRATAPGLAKELFLRTRQTHPELAEGVILSQLNDVVAWQVWLDVERGLSADPKRRPADSDSPDSHAG